MNLHAIANRMVTAVNPNTPALLSISTGYTVNTAGSRSPTYDTPIPVMAQVQPMSGGDIRKVENLNLQGIKEKVYISGNSEAMIRVAQRGGDIIQFSGQTWIVAQVLERWPDWCCLAITLQNGK